MSSGEEVLVQVEAWKAFAWLRHGFSTRRGGVSTIYRPAADGGDADGDLNLGWTKDDDPGDVARNRGLLLARVFEKMDATADATAADAVPLLVTVRQIHSAESLVVADRSAVPSFVNADGSAVLEGDGLMTRAKGLLLGIQTADCVPVLVADTRLRAVACFHAGWRGTAARIVERGIERMAGEFGSRPEDLTAAIGPSIGACCYSVGDEVYERFTSEFDYGGELFSGSDEDSPGYLDLWEANRRQLIEAGVPDSQITTVGECTGCAGLPGRRRYFSHRREQGFTGRMMSVIGVAGVPVP